MPPNAYFSSRNEVLYPIVYDTSLSCVDRELKTVQIRKQHFPFFPTSIEVVDTKLHYTAFNIYKLFKIPSLVFGILGTHRFVLPFVSDLQDASLVHPYYDVDYNND